MYCRKCGDMMTDEDPDTLTCRSCSSLARKRMAPKRIELPPPKMTHWLCVFHFPLSKEDPLHHSGVRLQLAAQRPLRGTLHKILIADAELKKHLAIEVLVSDTIIVSVPANREILDALPPLRFEGYGLTVRGESSPVTATLVLELESEEL